MLESYDLSCKFNGLTKDYTLKFKVAKGVDVSYSQVGDINKINLTVNDKLPSSDHKKTYKITGPLKVQFFQYSKEDVMLKSLTKPKPEILIEP
ncbi:MAG: hypothetical protein COB73_01505 [Flavobacteriaceae bacterium]|nr:MAG: hypothetical protein COB73_01505 [Flavobacteriaceae bacterium]